MTRKVWKKVPVKVQSALGTAVAITGITNANPAVVTHGGADPSNGDYLLLTGVKGMTELGDRVVRVANAGVGTFELEGIDSTNFNVFDAGSFAEITFGEDMSTVITVTASGGEPDVVDVTTIHDDVTKEQIVGFSPVNFEMENFHEIGDSALQALNAATVTKSALAVRFDFAGGAKTAAYGNISAPLTPSGAAGETVKAMVSVRCLNFPTNWSS